MTRLLGHELRSEGAPYAAGHRRGLHRRVGSGWSVKGTGYALCSCGAKSDVLTSGAKRKQWHREHKAEMSA